MRTAHGILAKYQIRDIITTLHQINIRILYVVYLKKKKKKMVFKPVGNRASRAYLQN